MNIARISIEGKEIDFRASGMTQIVYDTLFRGRNFLKDICKLKDINVDIESAEDVTISPEDLTTFANVCYTMHYQALSNEGKKEFRLKYPTALKWIDEEFNVFSIYEILPKVIELWNIDSIRSSKLDAKKTKPVES